MNDPVDSTEPAKPLRGQLGTYTEEDMKRNTEFVAYQMMKMLEQKVTRYPADYLLTDSIKEGPYGDVREIDGYWAGPGYGQMAKENILYLKRFVKKDSEMAEILDRWDAGDFSKVKDEYVKLVGINDPEYFVWCLEELCIDTSKLNIRTKRAEEFFLRTVHGQKGLDLDHEQWGTKE